MQGSCSKLAHKCSGCDLANCSGTQAASSAAMSLWAAAFQTYRAAAQ